MRIGRYVKELRGGIYSGLPSLDCGDGKALEPMPSKDPSESKSDWVVVLHTTSYIVRDRWKES
jgi:hypothetical protein